MYQYSNVLVHFNSLKAMYKIINPVEQNIKNKIEMYKNDMFNINHCIKRNLKENKRFRTELSDTKAKILVLEQQLNNLK